MTEEVPVTKILIGAVSGFKNKRWLWNDDAINCYWGFIFTYEW